MAGDDFCFLCGLAEHFDCAESYIVVGSAVETVAANHVFGVCLIGKTVDESFLGHCLMERSVENADHWSVGHDCLACADAHEICRVVQGCKIVKALDGFKNFIGEQNGFGKFFAAVNNAVTYCIDLSHV